MSTLFIKVFHVLGHIESIASLMHDAERQMLNVKYHDVYYYISNHKLIIEKLDFCLFSKASYRGGRLRYGSSKQNLDQGMRLLNNFKWTVSII